MGHKQTSASRSEIPLCPRKQTCSASKSMSALCQKLTSTHCRKASKHQRNSLNEPLCGQRANAVAGDGACPGHFDHDQWWGWPGVTPAAISTDPTAGAPSRPWLKSAKLHSSDASRTIITTSAARGQLNCGTVLWGLNRGRLTMVTVLPDVADFPASSIALATWSGTA